MMMENELKHYGVLGMKWGVRHDKNYRYSSNATKNYNKKSAKYTAKAANTGNSDKKKKYNNLAKLNAEKAKYSQKLDDRMLDNVKKSGWKANLYSVASLGGGSSKSYQIRKAANNKSKPGVFDHKSARRTVAQNAVGSALGRIGGTALAVGSLAAIGNTGPLAPVVAMGASYAGMFSGYQVSKLYNDKRNRTKYIQGEMRR